MPHVSSSGGGDDLGSEDEVKVFKDEGEEEKRSSENLTEDKSDLIDLTESEVREVPSCREIGFAFLPPSLPRPSGFFNLLRLADLSPIRSAVKYRLDVSFGPQGLRRLKVRVISCVAGKGLAYRRNLRGDGENIREIRPQQSCFR